MITPKFPQCVYLGEFHSPTYGNLPAYLPAMQGGFCLHYHTGEEVFANHQIENTVLCLLEELPTHLVQVHIIDFANRPNFLHLAQLKQQNVCQFYLNEHASTQIFNELEATIQTRYYTLFNSNDSHLDDYNARSPRPETYHILIINTEYFPNNSLSDKRLADFIRSAYGAGTYTIALHNCDRAIQSHEHSLHALVNTLPKIQISDNFSRLSVDENTLPVQKMALLDFSFRPADINQTQIIQKIQDKLTVNEDNGETDFLHIKIGSLPNGDDAFLSLGQKSENYSALLLGVPGSGKSTLLNNIIMQIGKNYHAGQIRLYLLDFAGVEFNQFKNHPNVEKIFLEANASEYGLTLLESLRPDIEIRRELFKSQNVKDINVYNDQNPDAPLPHILVMIDEFHRLFDGGIERSDIIWHRRNVNKILADIIREWRKFGIYLFLCTQTLKDVDLDTSLKDQLGLRISYRVNNESVLGAGIFDNRFSKTILTLGKYQALFQTRSDNAYSALIDKPLDIDNTIKQLRLTRPKHLQIQAEDINSQEMPMAQPQTTQPTEPKPNHIPTANDKPTVSKHSNRTRIDEILARTAYLRDETNDTDGSANNGMPDVFSKY